MREYRYLTHDDRLLIEKLYARGIAPSDIASVVGVSLATIYRELPRGYTDERFPGGRKLNLQKWWVYQETRLVLLKQDSLIQLQNWL